MFGLPAVRLLLFAQAQPAEAPSASYLPYLLFGAAAIMYFVMLRPQRQQEQKRKTMLDAIKKNDKVVTTGGIYGTVTSVDAGSDRIVLRIDDEKGVRVTFMRSCVARVVETSEAKPSES